MRKYREKLAKLYTDLEFYKNKKTRYEKRVEEIKKEIEEMENG